MTTPTPPDGAFTIGGGDFNFGQNYTETAIKALYTPPVPTGSTALDLLGQQLRKLPLQSLQYFKELLPDSVEEAWDTVEGAVDQIVSSLENNKLTNLIQDVKDTIDGMVRGLVGWIENGYTPSDVEAAAKDVANTLSDMRSVITALLASTGYAGSAVVVDFGGVEDASSLGSDWAQSYFSGSGTGTLGVSGGRAGWIGSADRRWFSARYSAVDTKSDYQKIGVAFATKPSRDIFGGHKSVNRILGRVSSDSNSFVAVEFEADGFKLGCQVSGSWTTWYTRTSTLFDKWEFKAGAAYWLECGTTGGARIYRVWENNKILTTFVESSATSSLGAGFRSVGMGGMAFSNTANAAQVAAFAFFDNQAAAKRGSGWRITRTSSGTANLSDGENTFPSSWFDTPDYITDDLTFSSYANKVTVAATGWYLITVKQHGDNAIIGGYSVQPTLRVNGSVVMRGQNFYWAGYNSGFSHSFIVYLNDGDYVSPGYWASATAYGQLGNGGADGLNVYWSGVFLGTNKKLPTTTT